MVTKLGSVVDLGAKFVITAFKTCVTFKYSAFILTFLAVFCSTTLFPNVVYCIFSPFSVCLLCAFCRNADHLSV